MKYKNIIFDCNCLMWVVVKMVASLQYELRVMASIPIQDSSLYDRQIIMYLLCPLLIRL